MARLLPVAILLLAAVAPSGHAQTAPKASARQSPARVSDGIAWSSLNANQRKALKPLEGEWDRIDGSSQTKWLTLANRFPKMSVAEQGRIQTRMDEWARLSPRERGQARMNFREAQQVPALERRAKWEAYKALPPEQRKQLAARATPVPPRKSPAEASAETARGKSNLVPNSSYAPKPKAITPTVSQARPGVTTNLITKRPHPPAHQQAGLPKIAVTSGFVDQSTLLPKRGPQGAAARSAPAPTPTAASRP